MLFQQIERLRLLQWIIRLHFLFLLTAVSIFYFFYVKHLQPLKTFRTKSLFSAIIFRNCCFTVPCHFRDIIQWKPFHLILITEFLFTSSTRRKPRNEAEPLNTVEHSLRFKSATFQFSYTELLFPCW